LLYAPFFRSFFNRLAKSLNVTRGEVPAAIKLRELQTLAEIAGEKNLIIVTPSGDVSTGNR
jgi:hypothetical protein